MNLESRALIFGAALFIGMLFTLELGRRLGLRRRAKQTEGGSAGISAVEAAVFALLGLMIAFTFQGAAARFDERRSLIVQEANHIGTAWLRVDLLPEGAQAGMRQLFRQYLDSRIETYRKVPDLAAVEAELARTARLQVEIWKRAIASEKEGGQKIVVTLLPALNAMFDIVTTRTMAAKTHPPAIVFAMLALLALAAALLAGHGMSGSRVRSWIHIVGFAAVLSITVYVILDMEYPRIGMIRLDSFDQVLVELRQGMK